MIRGRFLTGIILAVLVLGVLSGCSSKSGVADNPAATAEKTHIQKAAILLQEYTRNHKVPKTVAPVEKWALDQKKKGVDKDTFTSTRDHQPYDIAQTPMGPTLREVTGAGGKICIVLPGGAQEQSLEQVQGMTKSMQASQEQYQNK